MTVITASPKGFQKLLDLQQKSLTTLNSIQDILTVNKDDVAQQILQTQLDLQKQMSDTQQKQLAAEQDIRDSNLKLAGQEAKEIAELAQTLKNWKSFGDNISDLKKSFMDTFTGGNFYKSLLSAFNVGGIFNKKIRREEFIKSERAMGSDKDRKQLEKAFEQALKISKQIADNEKAITDLKKTLGRGRDVSDDQLGQTDKGKALLGKRGDLAGSYAAVDTSAKLFGKGGFSGDEPSAPLPKTPSDFGQLSKSTSTLAAETASQKETDNESLKLMNQQIDLLTQIATNTSKDGTVTKVKPSDAGDAGGGLMDSLGGIFSSLGSTVMKVFSNLFSFRSIFKIITKFFAPAMIIASLANGIIDGFKTFMETGSISEALIAGLGGVLEFITFGLFDKGTVRNVVEAVTGFVNQYVIDPVTNFINSLATAFQTYIAQPIQDGFTALMEFASNIQAMITDTFVTPIKNAFKPISDFFSNMVNAVMDVLGSIVIPGVSVKIPLKDDPISIGPWYPFGDSSKDKSVSQIAPVSANKVAAASKENEDNKAAASKGDGQITSNQVVSTVQNNQNTTQVVSPSVRNTESSQQRYMAARYV